MRAPFEVSLGKSGFVDEVHDRGLNMENNFSGTVLRWQKIHVDCHEITFEGQQNIYHTVALTSLSE